MLEVAVVILNWNGKHLLEEYIPTLLAYTTFKGADIVVADNGSDDASVSFLKIHFPSVKVLELGKNYGFAGGYNRALQRLEARYFVLLNSDVEVTSGWLDPLIRFMDDHPEAGACMPKIKSLHEKNKFEYAGAAGGFLDKYGYPFCRGRIFDVTEEDQGQYDTVRRVFWASGACMVVRAEAFYDSRGLDVDFFAHMEEIDLCWRMQRCGYQLYAVPQSVVYHLGGASLHEENPQKTYFNFRNNLYLLYKNLPTKSLWKVLFVRLILDGVASLKFLAGLQYRHHLAVWRAHLYFWSHLGMLRKKRKEMLPDRSGSVYGIFPLSIVFQFYIKRKHNFNDLKGRNLST